MIGPFSERRTVRLGFWSNLLWVALTLPALALPVLADQGEPLAIRTWPGGVVSMETHWDFEIVVDLYNAASLPQELAQADLVISRPHQDPHKLHFKLQPISSNDIAPAKPADLPTTVEWPLAELDVYLDRLVNEAEQTLVANDQATFVSKNAVTITQVDQRLLLLMADGVRVALPLVEHFGDLENELPIDALVAVQADGERSVVAAVLEQIQQLNPRWAIVSAPLATEPSQPLTTAVGNTWGVTMLSEEDAAQEDQAEPRTQWVQLQTRPWELSAELSELFELKEQACRQSQQTFAPLSAVQLNFKPANGTHTPRWNSEHMMGRELLFFSQIYAQQSPELQVMDLNPKQMPADYKPRHADWDGREEARQMERVSRFTRRFAYLLDGLQLDAPAPGSAWTLERLLKQMDRHYSEHTANVIKKFELPDWPKD